MNGYSRYAAEGSAAAAHCRAHVSRLGAGPRRRGLPVGGNRSVPGAQRAPQRGFRRLAGRDKRPSGGCRRPCRLRGQSDRPQIQSASRRRSRNRRPAPRAAGHHLARRGARRRRRGPRLWRAGLPRRHQPPPCRKGGGSGCRRDHRGVGRRRRPCGHGKPVRPAGGDTVVLSGRRHPFRRPRHRPRRGGCPDDGRGSCLYGHALHRHARIHGPAGLQGRDGGVAGGGCALHARHIGREREFPAVQHPRRRARPGKPARPCGTRHEERGEGVEVGLVRRPRRWRGQRHPVGCRFV